MKSFYRLAICALLFFCTMGKSFGTKNYEFFVNNVFEKQDISRNDVETCLQEASGIYKSSIWEGFFPFDEEKIPLTSIRATTKVDLLSLMASFDECNIIKKCYQILSLHAQDYQYGEYYQEAWNILEEIAFDRIKKAYDMSDKESDELRQKLCFMALDSVDSYLPEEVIEEALENIEKQMRIL